MPLKLKAPRKGKSPNITIRGTHLGVYVDKSSGSPRRSVARRIRDALERAIERGEYPPREAPAPEVADEHTFIGAANAYVAWRNPSKKFRRYIGRLIRHFRERPIAEFDQAAIDRAAIDLHPNASGATRNSMVYTPVSAILHHHYGDAGLPFDLRRPPGAKGNKRNEALIPEDAFGIIEAAESFDIEFAVFLMCLLYVGTRVGAGLDMQREDVRAEELAAWMRHQKGQPASEVRLREDLCDRLIAHLETHDRRRVFRFHYGGHLKYQLVRAKLAYLGIPHPKRRPVPWREPENRLKWVTFHTWRHTWATWMRRYGKATIDDLVDSNNWKDRRSAARYVHAVADDVWDRVDLLPGPGKIGGLKRRRSPSR